LIVIISFVYLMRRNGPWWIISIPGFYMVIYALFNVVGGPLLINDYSAANMKYIIALNLGMLIHVLVYSLTAHFYGFNFKKEMDAYVHRPIRSPIGPEILFRSYFIIALLICAGVSLQYLSRLPSIPLVEMIKHPSTRDLLAQSREAATTGFEGKYHRYQFFFGLFLPILTIIAFARFYVRRTGFWKWMFIFSTLFCIFMHFEDLQKSPVVFYLSSMVFTLLILWKKFSYKALTIFSLVMLGLLMLMYFFIMGIVYGGSSRLVEMITMRLFFAQTRGTMVMFQVIPGVHDFFYGTTFPNPGHLLPYEPFVLTKYIYYKMMGRGIVEGTAPCTYYMDFYANFGYAAMIASMFIGAFIIQWMQIFFLRKPKTLILFATYCFLIIHTSRCAISSALVVFGVPTLFLFLCLYVLHLADTSSRSIV
jgi:oligosaccharide repeat unit polymerase